VIMSTAATRRRALQIWRAALVGYALLVIIATHWPGSPPDPGAARHVSPDKLMHFMAFGSFVMLLWMSGWVHRISLITAYGLAFVLLDEWTQSIFALHREASGQDIAAGAFGVLAATAWINAMKPSWSPRLRMRDARSIFALNATITNQGDLLRVLAAGLIPPIVIALPFYLILWNLLGIGLGNLALTLGLLGGLIGAAIMLRRRMQKSLDDLDPDAFRREQEEWMDAVAEHPNGSEAAAECSMDTDDARWMDDQMPSVRMSMLLMTDGLPGLLCAGLFGLLIINFTPMLLMPSMQGGLAGTILYTSVFLLGAMLWSWQRTRLAELLDQDG